MLEVERLLVRAGPVDRALHDGKVIRVHAGKYHLHFDVGCGLVTEDAEGLLRPDDLPALHVPAEAARAARPWCHGTPGFGIRIAASQRVFDAR
jgi:hypothetical protein